MDPRLLDILVCPVCKGPLKRQPAPAEVAAADPRTNDEGATEQAPIDFELLCKADGMAFPVRDGIPVMLVDEARRVATPT